MDTFWQDLKYALRTLRKAPGFTATAVLTLGLGLGASVAVFSIVNAIYFTPLPYPDLDRLVMIETSRVPSLCHPACYASVTPVEVAGWRHPLASVEATAGVGHMPATVQTPAGPEQADVALLSRPFPPLL